MSGNQVLKRCPFCDSEAIVDQEQVGTYSFAYYVECTECSARHMNWTKEEDAINCWNDRVDLARYLLQQSI